MSRYVISDIHGCFDEFTQMLKKIAFSPSDELILGGDYIDRGPQNYEMLEWIEGAAENVVCLKGNHDMEFSYYVDLMDQIRNREMPELDTESDSDLIRLYDITWNFFNGDDEGLFDHYGTIRELASKNRVSFGKLKKWSDMINGFDYYKEMELDGRRCIVVHAGYIDSFKDSWLRGKYNRRETFFLYARDDAYIHGGVENGMIIAGHTPTISKGEITSNEGKVYRFYNESKNCIFYDIDCGCVFRKVDADSRLAALRLEDGRVFYV